MKLHEVMYWHLLHKPPLLPGSERKRGGSHWDKACRALEESKHG